MKILPTRPVLRGLALAFAVACAAVGVGSLPWAGERLPTAPRVIATARGAGNLRAAAASVPFALPPGTPIGGFARLSYASEGTRGPVGARALVLEEPGCRVALASVELLLVPEELEAEVRGRVADLGLAGLILTATHTHAGPGGFADRVAFERIATGPYDPKVRDAVVSAVSEAIRHAVEGLAPAALSTGRGAADDLARSRSGGREDAPLTVLRVSRPDGAAVAELTVFAAHATILGKSNRAISGDWPGRFVESGAHGTRLLFQGAIGDQSTEGPASASPRTYAAALSARVDALPFGTPEPAPRLAFAAVEVGLPGNEIGGAPALLRPAARNVAARAFPATARLEAIRLGPVLLVAVPGEPTAGVGAAWRASLLPEGAAVVSLANGYVGYVEEPARMASGAGETRLTYYGPELAAILGGAARAAAEAADAVPGPATAPAAAGASR